MGVGGGGRHPPPLRLLQVSCSDSPGDPVPWQQTGQQGVESNWALGEPLLLGFPLDSTFNRSHSPGTIRSIGLPHLRET